MIASQNGWPANRRDLVSPRYVPGTRVRLVVRNGAAGDLLLEVAALFDLLVQDIDATADDWGYAERPIRGSTVVSNHASGTAIDLNATCWTLGQPASVNLDPGQITKVREIVAAAAGVVRWGGDYTGRKDPMHFEISNGHTEADCAHALAALRAHYGRPSALQEDDDMSAETEQLIREMHGELFKRLPNRRGPQGAEIVGGGADTLLGYAANADGSTFRASWDLARISERLDQLVTAIRAAPAAADPAGFAAAVAAELALRLGK
jgi:hypothetical protein